MIEPKPHYKHLPKPAAATKQKEQAQVTRILQTPPDSSWPKEKKQESKKVAYAKKVQSPLTSLMYM